MTDRPFIVVIDDDPSVRKALQRLLQIAKMDVETYASGESFLLAVLARTPDCLLLDVRMPEITGPDLRDRLQGLGSRIPIVFMTAHEDGLQLLQGSPGFVDLLHKPFDDEVLLAAIGRAIQRPEVA